MKVSTKISHKSMTRLLKAIIREAFKCSSLIPCTKKETLRCSLCKNFSSKTNLYVCKSGHVVCENCNNDDDITAKRQDSGDFVPEQVFSPLTSLSDKQIYNNAKIKKNQSEVFCVRAKDLASGDHDKGNETLKSKRKFNSESKIRTIKQNANLEKKSMKTIFVNKHVKYCDNVSSGSNLNITFEVDEGSTNSHSKIYPRPIVCPESDCGKMIALDSVVRHFFFDHSKIPRITLISTVPEQIKLKATDLTMKPHCFTMFLLQDRDKFCELHHHTIKSDTSLKRCYNNYTPLMLMAVKLQTRELTIVNRNCNSEFICHQDVCTQTEAIDKQTFGKENKDKIDMLCSYTEESSNCKPAKDIFADNENILLWICQVNENASSYTYSYSVTVQRVDQKRGQSYIGETTNVRDKQDALTMHQSSECLILRGVAANRLLDDQNHLLIFVNILE